MGDYVSKPVRPDDPIIDVEQFDVLREAYDEPEALRQAVAMFAAELQEAVNGLTYALQVADNVKAQRLAHSVAGSAGTLGASSLATRARAIEAAIARDDIARAEVVATAIADLCRRSVAALTAMAGA